MKYTSSFEAFTAFFLCILITFSACSSTTVINSQPPGARVYIDGTSVGTTPYSHTDTKIVGSATHVRLTMEGYEDVNTQFYRNEQADPGAIIAGIFLLFPFLWTMKYYPARSYTLKPLDGSQPADVTPGRAPVKPEQSKAERLRDLKKLYDEGILSKAEYEAEKQKILNENR
ncbi:MAG: PEGA domain-containing protein [Saprospiraceae bacterium]